MRKFHYLLGLLLILSATSLAQLTGVANLSQAGVQYEKRKSGSAVSYSASGSNAIGSEKINSDTCTYRAVFAFDLNVIPVNATITQVNVQYSNGKSGYTFKLTRLVTVSADAQAMWSAIGTSGSVQTGITYQGLAFNSDGMKTAVQNSLSSRVLYVGALCESEGTLTTATSLSLSMTVNYTYPAAQLAVTVQNDLEGLAGGNIGVGINSQAVSRPSPATIAPKEGDRISLAAYDNQSVHSKNWVFNDVEAIVNKSRWEKINAGSNTLQSYSQSYTTDVLKPSDNNAIFVAYLKNATVTNSGTLSSNETWWTNVVLNGDVYVPYGVNLVLLEGMFLNLNGHSIVSSGGTIENRGAFIGGGQHKANIKSGSAVAGICSSIQSAVNYASANQTVEILEGTHNESISLSGKSNISVTGYNAIINGYVELNSSTNCTLNGLHLGWGYRYTLNYGTGTQLNGCTSDYYMGIYSYGSSYFSANSMSGTNGSDAEFGNYIYNGSGSFYNCSYSGHMVGIYSGGNAQVTVNQNYFCSNELDVFGGDASVPYVMENTYSRLNPVSLGGNYTYIPRSSDQACSNFRMAKTTDHSDLPTSTQLKADELDIRYMELINKSREDRLKSGSELKNKHGEEFEAIIKASKEEMKSASESLKIRKSLSRIVECYKSIGEKEKLSLLLTELINDSKMKAYTPQITRYLIEPYLENGEFKSALTMASNIEESKDADQDLKCEMLFEKGIINKYYVKDNNEAYKEFSTLISKYPRHSLAAISKIQISDMPVDSYKAYYNGSDNKSNGLTCVNYPNPFNPVTRFNVSIPEDGYTELKIYNSLGQEIKTIVSESLSKGQYNFEWNGESFASGIYYYTLKCGEKSFTNKMMLIK